MAKETNKEKALAALLITKDMAHASRHSGLSKRTLQRYLDDPEFVSEYRAARSRIIENAIITLQRGSGAAVGALARNLCCGNPSVEIRAAQIWLDMAMRGGELLHVVQRLEALEDYAATIREQA